MTLESWRADPQAQKKTWILLACVGAALTLLLLPLPAFKRWVTGKGSAANNARQVTPHGREITNGSGTTPPQPRVPVHVSPVAPFVGHWRGNAALPPQHGNCTLTLEITANPDDTSTGDSSLACAPPMIDIVSDPKHFDPAKVMALQAGLNPSSAILNGTLDATGTLQFSVKQNIGVAEANHGCNMTGAEATRFGGNRIAFTWHEEGCPGGQIVLTHVDR